MISQAYAKHGVYVPLVQVDRETIESLFREPGSLDQTAKQDKLFVVQMEQSALVHEYVADQVAEFSKGHTVPFPTVDNVTDGKSGNKKAVLKDWGEWFYKGNALVLKCTQGRWALSSEDLGDRTCPGAQEDAIMEKVDPKELCRHGHARVIDLRLRAPVAGGTGAGGGTECKKVEPSGSGAAAIAIAIAVAVEASI
jgi:hypothetical protein